VVSNLAAAFADAWKQVRMAGYETSEPSSLVYRRVAAGRTVFWSAVSDSAASMNSKNCVARTMEYGTGRP
jgi:hypothetical protein